MVGTRGNTDEYSCARSVLLGRQSRKSSRGAFEEPQDEIFWDSDEVRACEQVEKFDAGSSPAANIVSAMTKNKKIKGKGSNGSQCSVVAACSPTQEKEVIRELQSNESSVRIAGRVGKRKKRRLKHWHARPACCRQRKEIASVKHMKEESPTTNQQTVTPKTKSCKSSPKAVSITATKASTVSATKAAAITATKAAAITATKVAVITLTKESDVIETKAATVTATKLATVTATKAASLGPEAAAAKNKSPEKKIASKAAKTKTTLKAAASHNISGKSAKKLKTDVHEQKEEIEDEEEEDDKNCVDVKANEGEGSDDLKTEDEKKEEKSNNEEEEDYNDSSMLVMEHDQLSDDEFDDAAGLRRSSRRTRYSRPSWLMGTRRLRGYPSPISNDQSNARFVDSEGPSDEEVVYAVKVDRSGRVSRHKRLPRRYQEDTEEEEEISRGPGRPRGNKGRNFSSHHSPGKSVSRTRTTRKAAKSNKHSPVPRHRSIRILSDDDEEEDEEDETRKREVVMRPRRRHTQRVAYGDCSDTEAEYSARRTRNNRRANLRKDAVDVLKQQDDQQAHESELKDNNSDDDNDNDTQHFAEEEQQQDDQKQAGAGTVAGGSAEKSKRPSKALPTAASLTLESEDKDANTEDDQRRQKKKLSDPIFTHEDCLKFAKTLDSYNGKKRIRRPVARLNYSSNRSKSNYKSSESCSPSSCSSSSSSASSSDVEEGRLLKGYTLRNSNRKQSRELRERPSRRRNRGPGFLGSPARKPVVSYKRRTTHNKSSTSSSSEGGGDDEHKFEKRRMKSNAKARSQMLPMNFNEEDLEQATIKERSKVGSSLADVEPMTVERGITFSSVGGLNDQVRSLREMVVLPLLYPEVFNKFSVTPPRGVLFYGPPGTGKTLVARALANECSIGDKKVAFFMRKGADCLSKWVGESERQLRLLFDQAYQMRPSIIFFDEIDGLAPVRSSRQDQIHSSIVSTLLALMDGLDSRGEIIIIGATNRIEAIDPALRRPGRFDRELCFPLPSAKARQQILSVHTAGWDPQPSERLLKYLAEATTGYCGADIKSLCCESVLACLRSKYPQVYHSTVKLHLDLDNINVHLRHFRAAMNRIIPAGQRSRGSIGARLHPDIKPLLQRTLNTVLAHLAQCFPQGVTPNQCQQRRLVHSSISYRPRLLLQGTAGQGHSNYLGRALIHAMESLPAHKLDLAALYSNATRSPEEAVAQILHEACSRPPSIVFMPRIDRWFETTAESVRATFLTLLEDINPSTPVLLLATTHRPLNDDLQQVGELFSTYRGEVYAMPNPTTEERREYFRQLFYTHLVKHKKIVAKRRVLEPLPIAQMAAPRELSEKELQRLVEREEATLRELRIFLRQICTKLARNRQFCIFSQPVDVEDVPDYLEIISQPMDLETMMTKIDRHEYCCAQDFLKNIDLICANALEYNPNHSAEDQHIRHAACALRDTAYTLIKTEMDSDFEDKCRGIRGSRQDRNTTKETSQIIPEFVYTQPLPPHNGMSSNGNCSYGSNSSGAALAGSASKSSLSNNVRGKKRKKRLSSWARGFITKPIKKKPLLDKSEKNEPEDDEDNNDYIEDNDDSVRDVDSTNNMDITAAEKCAMELCNGELSSEDSPVGSVAEAATAHPLHTSRTSPSSTAGVSSAGIRRRSSAAAAASSSSNKHAAAVSTTNKPSAAVAAAISDDEEDLTVSSSERDEQRGRECEGVVDWSHLDTAYNNCVSATQDATVCQLQQLHTSITRLVRTHATTRDKTQLLLDTEAEIRRFVQLKAHM